jgi:signal peptidase I
MSTTKTIYREYFEAILIAVLFLRFANTFVVQTFYIPSASMEETLLVGDHLFVNRFIYGPPTESLASVLPSRDIHRGDILIFRSPSNRATDLVKRCVGLPGDRLRMENKVLYVNGQRVDDALYTRHVQPVFDPRRDEFGNRDDNGDGLPDELVVESDHFFMMGDNRDNSADSRYFGSVPRSLIKGRASLIYWSYGGQVSDGRWDKPFDRVALIGKTILGFPTKTRWKRTAKMVR